MKIIHNRQPSDNGKTRRQPTLLQLEDALHFARKHEQRMWGSGAEHEKARAEVERLESLVINNQFRGQRNGNQDHGTQENQAV